MHGCAPPHTTKGRITEMKKNIMRIVAVTAALLTAFGTMTASAANYPVFSGGGEYVAANEGTSADDDYKYFDPELNGSDENGEVEQPVRYDEDDSNGSKAGYKPNYKDYLDSYYFDAFDDISNLYQETHLYDFTKEELMDAFLRKLIKENPYLFKLFLNTMLSTMDPYSAYHESDSAFLNNSRGVYGFTIYSPDEFERKSRGLEEGIYVLSTVPGSGAEKAGLAVGDKIVSIGEFNVEGLPFDVVRTLVSLYPFTPKEETTPITINTIRDIVNGNIDDPETIKAVIAYFEKILASAEEEKANEAETPTDAETPSDANSAEAALVQNIVLGVERNGERLTLTVEKSAVAVSPVSMSIDYEKKIAVISITSFGAEGGAKDLFDSLEQARKMGLGNYIIDLRNNGGGYVSEALDAANLFITKENEILFYTNSRSMDKPEPYKSTGTGRNYGDIVILVNENTASASELFAMIVRDTAGAVLIGTTTYGKAVGQSVYTLMNGDRFTVTDSEILDTGLRSYNGKGLTPNIEIDALEMRYAFPEELRDMTLTYEDYLKVKPGEYSEEALVFEKFFAETGYFDGAYADGIVDENTVKAINAYLLANRRVADGVLTEDDINGLVETVNSLKAYFYTPDTQYMVAKMYFSSASQAKRLVKELNTAAKKAAADKQEIEEKYYEMIKKQEKEEKEAQKAAEAAETAETTETSEAA